jgi:hypothetical protein
MKQFVLVVAALAFTTLAYAEDSPDSEVDCLEAAKLLLIELDKIDPEHSFTRQSLTQQLYQESGDSGGGPYLCQAYILMGANGGDSLQSIALEYYVQGNEP